MNSKTENGKNHRGTSGPTVLAAYFAKFAQATAQWTGHPIAFLLALAVVVTWIVTGPVFNYSDTWQLVINTSTTIITFLMVFLIQNTQNRDIMAVQLKLSELVLAMKGAKNEFASIEDLNDKELQELHEDCRARVEMTLHHINTRRMGGHKPRAAAQRIKPHRRGNADARKS
ncbi:MAG TPA: low affinity iron permease family protein [Pseudolabrys sp.]|jgi:low affinity Fe/Cu permease